MTTEPPATPPQPDPRDGGQAGEPDWSSVFAAPAAPADQPLPTRRELRGRPPAPPKRDLFAATTGTPPPPPKKKRHLGWLWVLITLVVVIGGGATTAWLLFEDQVREVLGMELPNDYEGTGNGEIVEITIGDGEIGEDVARTLVDSGVTMTFDAFYDLLLATEPSPAFQPGTYALQGEMSAQSALDALSDPNSRVVSSVVIPEGRTIGQVLSIVADSTGIAIEELEAAADDYVALGVPKAFPSAEGYLFPATYTFDPGLSATDVLVTMVDRMKLALAEAGVDLADELEVLTLASIIQKEGGQASDFAKVSRVFTNRLDIGMHLESDATVTYGTGGTSIFTTDAERADASNPYNTYANPGLPVGPISGPGDAAIEAALNPVDGDWIFFVLVNGETGETKFSETIAEHEAGVAQFQQWLRDNPDYNTG